MLIIPQSADGGTETIKVNDKMYDFVGCQDVDKSGSNFPRWLDSKAWAPNTWTCGQRVGLQLVQALLPNPPSKVQPKSQPPASQRLKPGIGLKCRCGTVGISQHLTSIPLWKHVAYHLWALKAAIHGQRQRLGHGMEKHGATGVRMPNVPRQLGETKYCNRNGGEAQLSLRMVTKS